MYPFHECCTLYGFSSLTRKKSLQLDLRRNKCVPSVALQVGYFTTPNPFLSDAVFGKVDSGLWVSNFSVHFAAAILIPVAFASALSINNVISIHFLLFICILWQKHVEDAIPVVACTTPCWAQSHFGLFSVSLHMQERVLSACQHPYWCFNHHNNIGGDVVALVLFQTRRKMYRML